MMPRDFSHHPLTQDEMEKAEVLIQEITDEYAYVLGSGEMVLDGCFSETQLLQLAGILRGIHAWIDDAP